MVISTGLYFAFDAAGLPNYDLMTLFPPSPPNSKPYHYVAPYQFTHPTLKFSVFKFDRLPSGKFNVYGTDYNSPSPTKLIATWTPSNQSHFIPYNAGDENKPENQWDVNFIRNDPNNQPICTITSSVSSGVGIEGGPPKQRILVVVTGENFYQWLHIMR
jgi:hypothetical protein